MTGQRLYAIQNPQTGLVKIGLAIDPQKRTKDLECGSGVRLELLMSVDTQHSITAERFVHRTLEHYRQFGEWFRLPDPEALRPLFSQASALTAPAPATQGSVYDSAMNTDARIRSAIEKRMVESGLSAADVARRLNVKHQSVAPLLRGDRGKVPQSLIDLLDVLDLELVVQPKLK